MEQDDTYRATLVRAAEILGGVRQLSDRLHVPITTLIRWLAGDGKPPIGTFLRAIDVLIEESQRSKFLPSQDSPQARKPADPDGG